MIAGPGMSPCSLCPGQWRSSYCPLVSILYGFLLIFVVNDPFADCSSYWPLCSMPPAWDSCRAGGALLCSVKVCATNLCCLNLNSQFCCSKHLLPTGQTSPGPEAAIRRSTAHLSSCHLQPNKESHNMVIGDINGTRLKSRYRSISA